MASKLTPMYGFSEDQVREYLQSLDDRQRSAVVEEMEYFLLCYPHGTGDDELEDLLENLSLVVYED